MTKTIEIQLEKSRMLSKGMRRHVDEMGERGMTRAAIAQFENDLAMLERQNAETDKLRADLRAKVKRMNSTLEAVKTTYSEAKKTIKGYYPQERWLDYGVPDKR